MVINKIPKEVLYFSLSKIISSILDEHNFRKIKILVSFFTRNDILCSLESDLVLYYKIRKILKIMKSNKNENIKRLEVFKVLTKK